MKTEAELQHLYKQLTGILDPEGANTMIDVVSPFARNELATKSDLALVRADMALLRGDFVELRGEMRLELQELRSQMRLELEGLRGEMRSELQDFRHDLVRTMAGWIFLSQAALVAVVALVVSLA